MKLVVITLLLFSFVVGGIYLLNNQTSSRTKQQLETANLAPSPTTSPNIQNDNTYTLAQVNERGDKDNCWMAIEGKVYDITPYIMSGSHPGKLVIVMGCGKDATELFNTRLMGSGTAHSERARDMLSRYYVGELVTE